MSSTVLFMLLALILVLEGILPFLAPQVLRRILIALAGRSDVQMRVSGLICLLLGAAVMVCVHLGYL
jgi:uncharacterized protein